MRYLEGETLFLKGGSESGGFRPQGIMDRSTGKALKMRKAAAAAVLVSVVSTLAFSGAAWASAEDQYVEVVPSPGTERPSRGLGGGAADPGRFDLTGPDAAAIARIAALFATEGDSRSGDQRAIDDGETSDVPASLFGAGAGGGMGLLLPLALLATLAIGIGSFFLRRRGGADR